MEGKSLLEHISELKESLQEYVETRASYYGLLALERAVKVLTSMLSGGVVVAILLLALLLFSLAGALALGSLLGRLEYGLLAVGGFYLLLALLVYLLRNSLFSSCVTRSLVKGLFGDDPDKSSS